MHKNNNPVEPCRGARARANRATKPSRTDHPVALRPSATSCGHGFTTIELLTVLAVAAIGMALATEPLTRFVMTNRISGETNGLLTDLMLARSEATKLRVPVVVGIAQPGRPPVFSGTDWAAGRGVFADTNSNGAFDAGDTLLRYSTKLPARFHLTNADSLTTLVYRPNGTTNAAAGTRFTLCTPGYYGRDIVISPTGRAYVATRTSLTCPGAS